MIVAKVVLVVEYDGTNYHGFQLQAKLPTIQEEIEKALLKLTGGKTRVMSASRTDVGVHARGQTVSFRTGSSLTQQAYVGGMNYYLPRDIAVKAVYRVKDSFNVRRDAISREYNYYILNSRTPSPMREGFSYRVNKHLDIKAMNGACRSLIGEHDFDPFASAVGIETRSTVRRVYRAEMKKEGEMAIFTMVANSFLTHQVRNTVGTLIRVGLGKMKIEEFCSIIEKNESELVGPAAPARGLCLMQVNYAYPFEEEI